MNKIVEVAKRFFECLEVKTRETGEKFVCFKPEVIEKNTEEYRKLSEVIWGLKKNLGEDFVYWEVYNCLSEIIDLAPETEEGLEDILENIEPDVYTSDLTEWLNEHNGHVFYLTEALETYEIKDGFELLAVAQELAKREVWTEVIELIRSEAEEEEDLEEI